LGVGWSEYRAGNLDKAAEAFDEVLKVHPPEAMTAEAALARGQILERLRQNDAALAMYAVVIEQCPQSVQHGDALLAAARLQARQKQYDAVIAYCDRFAKEHPKAETLDAVLYEWAWALQESHQIEAAAERFKQLYETHRTSRYWGEAAYRLAQRAFEAKQFEPAANLVSEVLQNGNDPRVREYAAYLRGQIAAAQADWPKTREAFEAFLREFAGSPRCTAAEFWIAETFYRQEESQAAKERFDRLAEKVPEKREPWMAVIPLRRAQLSVQQNAWDEAFKIASQIASDFPNFEQQYEADYVLGRCLANQADFDGARLAYDKVIHSPAGAKTETAAMAQWMIGETFFHQKNYTAAIREYLRLEILYAYPTWQSAALLQAGKCHEFLGEGKAAAELYRRIVKTYPDTPFAEQARQKLQNTPARRGENKQQN
jgi:TolA-binding protein